MGRRRHRSLVLATALLALTAVWAPSSPDAEARGGSTRPPVLDGDVPDPEIVWDGNGYLVYSTNSLTSRGFLNVPVHRWTGGGQWELVGDALPRLGTWTTRGATWAPGVFRHGTSWLLFYASPYRRTGRHCIGVATAATAVGPFVDRNAEPLVCQLDDGGSIDPSPFHDDAGDPWLAWKLDANAVGRATRLQTSRLTPDGHHLTGPVHDLLRSGARWEQGIVENPEMVRRRTGWTLLYSGGAWESAGYGMGTAACAGPAGPCSKHTTDRAWFGTAQGVIGAGGASVVEWGGVPQLVFHGWSRAVGYRHGGSRSLHVEPIDFSMGRPRHRPDQAALGRPDDRSLVTHAATNTPVGATSTFRYGRGATLLACDFAGSGADHVTAVSDHWYRSDRPVDEPSSVVPRGSRHSQPLCGDLDGDGRDEPIEKVGNVFYSPGRAQAFGRHGDIGLVGDWNADGVDRLGVYRPSTGSFHLQAADGRAVRRTFGDRLPGDQPVVGDWDGDGVDELGLRRGATFHLEIRHPQGRASMRRELGTTRSAPVIGDWDGRAGHTVGVVD